MRVKTALILFALIGYASSQAYNVEDFYKQGEENSKRLDQLNKEVSLLDKKFQDTLSKTGLIIVLIICGLVVVKESFFNLLILFYRYLNKRKLERQRDYYIITLKQVIDNQLARITQLEKEQELLNQNFEQVNKLLNKRSFDFNLNLRFVIINLMWGFVVFVVLICGILITGWYWSSITLIPVLIMLLYLLYMAKALRKMQENEGQEVKKEEIKPPESTLKAPENEIKPDVLGEKVLNTLKEKNCPVEYSELINLIGEDRKKTGEKLKELKKLNKIRESRPNHKLYYVFAGG